MLTLSAVVGLWAMARPVNLPRRARLAVNATLAMAGAQVKFHYNYIALRNPFSHHLSLFFLGFTGDINLVVLRSSPLGCVTSVRFLSLTHVYSLVWTRN